MNSIDSDSDSKIVAMNMPLCVVLLHSGRKNTPHFGMMNGVRLK